MARVAVEQKALTDIRFKSLGREIGADRWAALGRMFAVWNECQERGEYVLSRSDLDLVHDDLANFAAAVLASDLGRVSEDGAIYICGTRGRIEWLERKRNAARENGSKGGRPRKTDIGSEENLRRFPRESSPAPATAPVPVQKKEPSSPAAPLKSAKDLVEGLSLDARLRQLGESLSVDPVAELEQFKDRMRGNGYRTNQGPVKDASAAFRTHLRNAAKFDRTTKRQPPIAAFVPPMKD